MCFQSTQRNDKIDLWENNNIINNSTIDLNKQYSKKDRKMSNKTLTNAQHYLPLLNYKSIWQRHTTRSFFQHKNSSWKWWIQLLARTWSHTWIEESIVTYWHTMKNIQKLCKAGENASAIIKQGLSLWWLTINSYIILNLFSFMSICIWVCVCKCSYPQRLVCFYMLTSSPIPLFN